MCCEHLWFTRDQILYFISSLEKKKTLREILSISLIVTLITVCTTAVSLQNKKAVFFFVDLFTLACES